MIAPVSPSTSVSPAKDGLPNSGDDQVIAPGSVGVEGGRLLVVPDHHLVGPGGSVVVVLVVVVVVAAEVAVVVGATVVLVAGGDVVVEGEPSPLWQAANASKTARKPPRARRLMTGGYARCPLHAGDQNAVGVGRQGAQIRRVGGQHYPSRLCCGHDEGIHRRPAARRGAQGRRPAHQCFGEEHYEIAGPQEPIGSGILRRATAEALYEDG